MQEVCIEKNIPIPTQGRGVYKRLADDMQVGDSVLFTDDLNGFGKTKYASAMAYGLLQRLRKDGKNGCQRRMNNGRPQQVRVWRTE
tara:strand:- start:470 stop:727 length:258 start_codon:yes stop_codon:yes gene_type:complete